jgi:hypothetical protein
MIKNEQVTQKELELAKAYIAGAFARSLESPQTVAGFALNINMYGLPADYYETYLQKLQAVTIEDVARVARKYITPEKARIVVVGNKDEVMPKLAIFDKEDGVVQLYDIYANPKKDESQAAVDITAEQLIENYLTAIGGREKLDAVKTIDQTYSMELMGMSITARIVQGDGKFYMNMTAPGMNIMKQVFDGEKGTVEQMGQVTTIEGDDLNSMKDQAILFPERNYKDSSYSLELKGLEDINGAPAYKLSVTKPNGSKSTEFYDKTSFLKLKEISTAEADGQSMTTTNEYSDYKTVDGVMIPHTVSISGPMPTPMVMKAQEVRINGDIDPSLFKS